MLNTVRFILVCVSLLAGLTPLASPPARAAAAPGFPFAGLSVSAGKEIKLTASNAGVYTFGTRYLPSPGLAQAVFVLRNMSALPLTLDRLQPTCHCTTAEVLGGSEVQAADHRVPVVPPGGSLKVRVTVILSGHAPGPLLKSVLIFVSGHSDPAARLDMSGTLLPERSVKTGNTLNN